MTDLLDATNLRRLSVLPLDDWTFHVSVACGETLPSGDWKEIESTRVHELKRPVREGAAEVDLVSYSPGEEHIEIIRLGF